MKLREKILTLEDQLSKQSTEAKMNQVAEWEKLDKHKLELEKDAADQALAAGRISQLERLDLEIEFENRRYQIAYDALQERIALAEQDPTYSQTAIDKLKAQMAELGQGHERTQAKNEGKWAVAAVLKRLRLQHGFHRRQVVGISRQALILLLNCTRMRWFCQLNMPKQSAKWQANQEETTARLSSTQQVATLSTKRIWRSF